MTCTAPHRHSILCVVPPHMLEHVASHGRQRRQREAAARTLGLYASLLPARAAALADLRSRRKQDGPAVLARTVRDARHRATDAGKVVRGEGGGPTGDPAADEAYDGLGATFDYYTKVLGRNGIDGLGGDLEGIVHYDKNYDNAFFDGRNMHFGDGDGVLFNRFTVALDIMPHELTHAATAAVAGLDYQGQAGALNESVSDRIAVAVLQSVRGLAVGDPDGWLIGKGLLAPGIHGRALRDMANPGTAYDDPQLGKDPQPRDMKGYVRTRSDNGGVHINSGIPNRAFHLLATALGDTDKAALITYGTLRSDDVPQDCDFATWCAVEIKEAERLYGVDGRKAAADAWAQVGVLTPAGEAAS